MGIDWRRFVMICLLAIVTGAVMPSPGHAAEQESARKTTKTVTPVYHDGRTQRCILAGTVKLAAVVSAEGQVTSTEVIGGQPDPGGRGEGGVSSGSSRPQRRRRGSRSCSHLRPQ